MKILRNYAVSVVSKKYYATPVYNYSTETVNKIIGKGRSWHGVKAENPEQAIKLAKLEGFE